MISKLLSRPLPQPSCALLLLGLIGAGCDARPPVTPIPPEPVVDTVAPQFLDVPSEVITESAGVEIHGRVRDNRRVESLTMRIGTGDEQPVQIARDTASDFVVRLDIPRGITPLTLAAEDSSGNRSTVEVQLERIAGEVLYEVVPLGSLGGGQTFPNDLNNHRQVVGWSLTPDSSRRAFIWEEGEMRALDTLDVALSPVYPYGSRAEGINDSGVIVGVQEHLAIVWEGGIARDLGVSGSRRAAQAHDVNDHGLIVGGWRDWGCTGCPSGAFAMDSSGVVTLDSASSRASSVAYAANDDGTVVGVKVGDCYMCTNPFIYEGGQFRALNGAPESAVPLDINATGQVVGGQLPTHDPYIYPLAFLWEDGAITSLGSLHPLWTSEARGVNASGHAVGISYKPGRPAAEWEGFIWREGTMTSLANVVGPEWHITEATAINDHGEITALGRRLPDGEIEGVLLLPLP